MAPKAKKGKAKKAFDGSDEDAAEPQAAAKDEDEDQEAPLPSAKASRASAAFTLLQAHAPYMLCPTARSISSRSLDVFQSTGQCCPPTYLLHRSCPAGGRRRRRQRGGGRGGRSAKAQPARRLRCPHTRGHRASAGGARALTSSGKWPACRCAGGELLAMHASTAHDAAAPALACLQVAGRVRPIRALTHHSISLF